ncbi:MAG TPA: dihydrodipicolinate synthase family protein [Planctomycetaceae bacterium]|nr:dihydrodipicolinate synthase family protein [Planctomycetaceae bacterium]HRF00818.1 dihydrodipicolinate synthase family protein [Pirellulaceae bacterium]
MAATWQGVFPAVTTQFREDQSLDLDATARHHQALIDSGIAGLVVCGSLGENQTMTHAEKLSVVETAVKVAAGRIPVLTGVAESSTRAAVDYVREAEKRGAAGLMIMPPMVYKADKAEAHEYFRTVGGAVSVPWMLYNNPVGYTVDITPEQLVELSDVANLVAVKESSANTRRIIEIRQLLGDRLALFAGVDDLIMESSMLGIDGWVAGSGIAFPAENQRLWDLLKAERYAEARQLYRWFQPLMKLDTDLKFVQYIKLAVQEAGLGKEWVRAPRKVLSGAERQRVMAIIRKGLDERPKL